MGPKRIQGRVRGSAAPTRQSAASTSSEAGSSTGSSADSSTGSSADSNGQSAADQALLQEIAWCLDRLEVQMKQQKTTARQVEDARRAWKNLSSQRTPLVKKRQIMRMMFGDYRATMEREEREFSIKPQGMRLTSVPVAKAKAKYFKSSTYCPSNVLQATTKDFQFGFSLSDEPPTDSASVSSSHLAQDSIASDTNGQQTGENYFLIPRTAHPFTFNFDIDTANT